MTRADSAGPVGLRPVPEPDLKVDPVLSWEVSAVDDVAELQRDAVWVAELHHVRLSHSDRRSKGLLSIVVCGGPDEFHWPASSPWGHKHGTLVPVGRPDLKPPQRDVAPYPVVQGPVSRAVAAGEPQEVVLPRRRDGNVSTEGIVKGGEDGQHVVAVGDAESDPPGVRVHA